MKQYWALLFGLALTLSKVAFAGTPAPLWAAEILDANDRLVCSGALISSRTVVTASHCFGEKTTQYHVRLGANEIISVDKITSYSNGLLAFPNYDVAILHLHADARGASPITLAKDSDLPTKRDPTVELFFSGFGIDPVTHKKISRVDVPATALRMIRRLNGFRLRNLAEVNVIRGKRLCRGDSGGPVYVKKGSTQVLVGVVSGRLEGIADYSDKCTEGHDLITLLAPYREWLEGGSSIKTAEKVGLTPEFVNLEQACRGIEPGTTLSPFVDEVIEQYVNYRQQHSKVGVDFTDLFLKCTHMDDVMASIASGEVPLVIRGQISPEFLPLVRIATNIRAVDVDDRLLSDLKSLPNLDRLVVSGLRWQTSLKDLELLHVKYLEVRYGPCVRDVSALSAIERRGVKPVVVGVTECGAKDR